MIKLLAIKVPKMTSGFDLLRLIDKILGIKLKEGDILVISSKFIATSEGRSIRLDKVKVSEYAKIASKTLGVGPRLSELIIREADGIVGSVPGFALAVKDGLLTPNAGIDKSNVEHNHVILYPRKALDSAILIREYIKFKYGIQVGIVISDSRLMPSRKGTTGVAIAASGLEAVLDLRGRKDLFGNPLKVTLQAIADDLSSAAQLIMGESDDKVPIVLVRGKSKTFLREKNYASRDLSISTEECVYMRSLSRSPMRMIPLSS